LACLPSGQSATADTVGCARRTTAGRPAHRAAVPSHTFRSTGRARMAEPIPNAGPGIAAIHPAGARAGSYGRTVPWSIRRANRACRITSLQCNLAPFAMQVSRPPRPAALPARGIRTGRTAAGVDLACCARPPVETSQSPSGVRTSSTVCLGRISVGLSSVLLLRDASGSSQLRERHLSSVRTGLAGRR